MAANSIIRFSHCASCLQVWTWRLSVFYQLSQPPRICVKVIALSSE